MTAKHFIKFLIPPIFYKIRRRLHHTEERKTEEVKITSPKVYFQQYINEINYRRNLSFDAISELSRDISFDMLSAISIEDAEANYYGAFYTLQKYVGDCLFNIPPSKLTIQHGILYGMMKWLKEKKDRYNLVWSAQTKKLFDNELAAATNVAIGCPFLYAQSVFSPEQINNERKRLGKNLLAIPMHSTHFINNDYEIYYFLDILKKQRRNFDTVRVCLYWRDVQRGIMQIFKDEGFECVCCGHMFDPLFLNRQRSLLEIADATISNGVGSHIGYSLSLGKPHWLVPDEFKLTDIKYAEGMEEQKIMMESACYKNLKESFINNEEFIITQGQQDLVDEIWGISCMKSPTEMKRIINDAFTYSNIS